MSEAPDPRKTRRIFLLLAAISLAPFLGSLLLYYFWEPRSFTNYGELMPVKPLGEATVKRADGSVFRFAELRGKWIFLMVDSGACDDYCRSKLYLMRQIRLTQGKDQGRIERLWMIPDGQQPGTGLLSEYQGTHEVVAAAGEVERLLPAAGEVRAHVYMVDPLGNLMMRFPRDADLRRVKKDVSKLLKASSGWVQVDK